MPIAGIILGLIQIAQELVKRGRQTGELTDAQAADLKAKADAIFAQWSSPAPPPPGV